VTDALICIAESIWHLAEVVRKVVDHKEDGGDIAGSSPSAPSQGG
jgi:hypothetical protein